MNANPNTATGLAAGTYTVTATDANGCSAVQTIVIKQPTSVVAQIVGFTNESCPANNDGTSTVVATGGITPYTYDWGAGANPTLPTNTGLAAGNYTVTVYDANLCSATASVTITEPAALTANISASTNVSCFGGADGTAMANASGGMAPYSYLWSNGSTDKTATGLAAGIYSVTISNACGTVSDEMEVYGLQEPEVDLGPDTLVTPHPYVCRACGHLTLTPPTKSCPACGAWAETFQKFMPN